MTYRCEHFIVGEKHWQNTDHASILLNVVCTSRQLTFKIIRNNKVKIGINTALNKFYHINKLIALNNLNLGLTWVMSTLKN